MSYGLIDPTMPSAHIVRAHSTVQPGHYGRKSINGMSPNGDTWAIELSNTTIDPKRAHYDAYRRAVTKYYRRMMKLGRVIEYRDCARIVASQTRNGAKRWHIPASVTETITL